MITTRKSFICFILTFIFLLSVSCAPGNIRYEENPAGFWAGVWHGLICGITFIISLFSDSVHMYEINNAGNWYNFGFLIGVMIVFGGGSGRYKSTRKKKSAREKDWDEIGSKVEDKIRRGIKNWVEESENKQDDWEEIGRKIEEKIKRELKNWAEK